MTVARALAIDPNGRYRVHGLRQRHADHRPEWVSRSACRTGRFKLIYELCYSGESRMSDRSAATDHRATFWEVIEAATP